MREIDGCGSTLTFESFMGSILEVKGGKLINSSFFTPALLRYNLHITLPKFKVYKVLI